MKITITVPIPKTNQNATQHHRVKSLAAKQDREAAKTSAMCEVVGLDDWQAFKFPWTNPDVIVRWYHPTSRFRDKWNIVGCLKSTLDGIVRAGLLTDDDEIDPPSKIERLTDKANPRVEIDLIREITESEATND